MKVEISSHCAMCRPQHRRSQSVDHLVLDRSGNVRLQDAVMPTGIQQGDERTIRSTWLELYIDARQWLADLGPGVEISGNSGGERLPGPEQ